MIDVVNNFQSLKKRVLRLLRMDLLEDKSELSTRILPFLNSLGDVVLIGGAIRDVARAGKRAFTSDLDFVVHSTPHSKFHDIMRENHALPNKFGGYGMKFYTHKVDIWHIEDTWAKTAGHREINEPKDLLDCTFFDWDSALFDLGSRSIISNDGYIDRLKNGVMDVCLTENPNPEGSLIRAIRRAALWNISFGPKLSNFSREQLIHSDWQKLIEIDSKAFGTSILKYLDVNDVRKNLDAIEYVSGMETTKPVSNWKSQLELPLQAEPNASLGRN